MPDQHRCAWPQNDAQMLAYHDREWGVPLHDDRRLFEFLVLEGAQAGLSWRTILHKRGGYAAAFADFDPEIVACFCEADVQRLMQDARIVRNGAKIKAAIGNARAFLEIQRQFGSFDAYQWRFVDGRPLQNVWQDLKQLPAVSPISDAFSRDMKQRGFRFVGSTVVYAHMQAVGMVNDHVVGCFRHLEVAAMK